MQHPVQFLFSKPNSSYGRAAINPLKLSVHPFPQPLLTFLCLSPLSPWDPSWEMPLIDTFFCTGQMEVGQSVLHGWMSVELKEIITAQTPLLPQCTSALCSPTRSQSFFHIRAAPHPVRPWPLSFLGLFYPHHPFPHCCSPPSQSLTSLFPECCIPTILVESHSCRLSPSECSLTNCSPQGGGTWMNRTLSPPSRWQRCQSHQSLQALGSDQALHQALRLVLQQLFTHLAATQPMAI